MKKAVLLITIVILSITGCSRKSSVTEQTTAIETTVTMETKGSDNTSLSAESETTSEADIYGNLGKEFFQNNVITNWKNYTIPDEQTLRERMDTVYGDLSTKEDLIQEVLATPRDPQPTQSAETQAAETQTQPQGGSNTNGGNSNTTTPKETKNTTPKETKSNTTATQAPAVDPSKKAEVDAKIKEWENTPAHVDDQRGGSAPKRDADDAVKQWQWQ